MDPGEELVSWLVLFGQLDGGVGEAVLLHMPVSVPAVGEDMAAGLDLVLEEAVQTFGTGVREYRQRCETGDRGPARLASGAVFDGHGHHRLVASTAALARFAVFFASDIALIDLDQAAQGIVPVAILHGLANLVFDQPCRRVADA